MASKMLVPNRADDEYQMIESDSWIELSSNPSDSMYTSSSDEHIITSGLRVSQPRRKRRGTFRATSSAVAGSHPAETVSMESSDDEEEKLSDEAEAADDAQDLASLIDEMPLSSDGFSSEDEEAESDDEASASDSPVSPLRTRTRLNNGSTASVASGRTVFSSSGDGNLRRQNTRTTAASLSGADPHHYASYNAFAPSHAADHDAALRASLSTLLSCAAAARGLPKSRQAQQASASQSQNQRVAVESLRVVREPGSSTSSTMPEPQPEQSQKQSPASPSSRSRSPAKKSKSKSRRGSKSPVPGALSPTNISLLTIAFSAGALVILSALTFSAGYAMGKEVGKTEGGGLLGAIKRGRGLGRGRAVGVASG
ncbi:hypothetical protein RUND412_002997 [Rhizina undulata]